MSSPILGCLPDCDEIAYASKSLEGSEGGCHRLRSNLLWQQSSARYANGVLVFATIGRREQQPKSVRSLNFARCSRVIDSQCDAGQPGSE